MPWQGSGMPVLLARQLVEDHAGKKARRPIAWVRTGMKRTWTSKVPTNTMDLIQK